MTGERGRRGVVLRSLALAGLALGGLTAAWLLSVRATTAQAVTNVLPLPSVSIPTIPTQTVSLVMTPSTTDPTVGTPFTVQTTLSLNTGLLGNVSVVFGGFGSALEVESSGASAGSCAAGSSGTYDCTLGIVNAGTNVAITVTLLPTAAGAATLSGQVESFGATTVGTLSLPAASASVTVAEPPAADLALRVSSTTLELRVGSRERVGVVAANSGSLASDATLTLVLPATTKVVSATPRAGRCAGSPLVCNLGALAPQGTNLVVLTLQAQKPGTGQLTATLSGTNTATGATTPSGSLTIVVSPRPPAHPKKR